MKGPTLCSLSVFPFCCFHESIIASPMASQNLADNSRPPFDPIIVTIADYVYNYEVKSASAMAVARLTLLDALGCSMETVASGECSALIGPMVKNCTVSNGFRLPGTSYELDPVKGAFDLGILIRYLDHNDGFIGAEWGHPSGRSTFTALLWLKILIYHNRQHRDHSRDSRLSRSQSLRKVVPLFLIFCSTLNIGHNPHCHHQSV